MTLKWIRRWARFLDVKLRLDHTLSQSTDTLRSDNSLFQIVLIERGFVMQSIILLYIKETDGRPADGAIQSRIGWEDFAPVSVQCFLIWSCSCPRLVWLLVDSPHLSIPRLVLHNMCSLSHVSLSGLLIVLVRLLLFPGARSPPVPWRISPVPLPEPSPPSPRCEERKPEPTEDGEPVPAAIDEPAQCWATERRIAPKVQPNPFDQVREPAATPIAREKAADAVSAERSSAPCTVAEGELMMDLGRGEADKDLIDWEADLLPLLPPSSEPLVTHVPMSSPVWAAVPTSCPERAPVPLSSPEGAPDPEFSPENPEAHKCPPSHPLLPPPPLSSVSPSARPQLTISTVWAPRVFHRRRGWRIPYLRLQPLRPIDPAAPPRLLAPLPPPSPIDPPAPPGSLVPPAPPWSGVDPPSPQDSAPPAAPRRSIQPAPVGSFLPPAPPWSSVAPALPRISTSVTRALGSTLAPRILGMPLARWLSVSASGSSTTCSAAVGRPPGVGSHSSSMAPPSIGSTMGRHYGCGLCPAWLLPLRVPPVFSLSPPSFVATLVSARRPPPGDPSSSWPSSLGPIRPSSSVVLQREDASSGKGAICQDYGPVFCSVFPYLIMFLSSFSLIISWFPAPVYPSFSLV